MKFAALCSVTILSLAIALSTPALAEKKDDRSPNDVACIGAWNFCQAACNVNNPNGAADAEEWARCSAACDAQRYVCEGNDDVALRISLRNPSVSLSGSSSDGGTGGSTGGSGGSFNPGSVASTGNAGVSTGGAGVIY